MGAGAPDGGADAPAEEIPEAARSVAEEGQQRAAATWDAGSVFQSLNRDTDAPSGLRTAIALRSETLGIETRVMSLNVGPSNVQYFTLASVPGAPGLSLSIETAGGMPTGETAEPLMSIVRTK